MKKLILTLLKSFAAVTAAAIVMPSVYAGEPTVVSQNGYGIVVSENKLAIPKEIMLRNGLVSETLGGTSDFVKPNITFTYTISPATIASNTVVTDSTSGNVMHVKAGVPSAVSLENDGKIEFVYEGGKVANSETIEKSLIVDINPNAFSVPGVYRYIIEDTTSIATLYNTGIIRSRNTSTVDANGNTVPTTDESRVFVKDRYLDIYIKEEENGTKSIAGYVLMKNNPTNNTNGNILKSEGYTTDDGSGYDSYRNYYGRVSKIVAGGMGDKTHEFPFIVTVENNGAPFYCGKDPNNLVFTEENAYNPQIKLKHGDTFYIQGLSPHAKISYKETNDTTEKYLVKAQVDDGSSNGEVLAGGDTEEVSPNGSLSVNKFDVSNYEALYQANHHVSTTATINPSTRVKFTNK